MSIQGLALIFLGYVRAAVNVNSNLNEPTGHDQRILAHYARIGYYYAGLWPTY